MEKPTIEQITAALKEKFSDSIISQEQQYDFPVFTIKKESVVPVIKFLYDHEQFQFRYLTTMCGLHYPEGQFTVHSSQFTEKGGSYREPSTVNRELFGMMYQVHSLVHNIR